MKSFLVLAAFISCQCLQAQGIDSVIERIMKDAGLVGVGASIIKDNKVVWTKGYGYADKENNIPFTPNTIMNIGSISKTFTGVCLMKAVEEKKLSLDEDINEYLPFKVINPNFPNDKITLRQLATHTSGLVDRWPFYTDTVYVYGQDPTEPLGEFLKNYFVPGGKYYTPDNFLKEKPGTYRDYSNIAAGLAGFIVERVTGMGLNKYSKKHIFDPLKMSNSGWFLKEVDLALHSKHYSKDSSGLKLIPLYSITTYPDGGVRTSVSELSRFFIALLNNGQYEKTRILKKGTAEEMTRFQFTSTNKPSNIELNELNSGIFWATKFNTSRIGHNGSDPGVRTNMLSDLDRKIGVIFFVNTSLPENQERVYAEIYRELYKYAQTLK